MSSSARRSEAPQGSLAKKCRALLDWADEDICPYVVRGGLSADYVWGGHSCPPPLTLIYRLFTSKNQNEP